ncbi:hypothetical protein DY78_GL000368 [Lactiplantibacillus fabifermentans DSM 21115]|uniref:Uncharacterized protein n=1 Tax=Lactiplantibacillus fabifermentans DSM 21115 TaxID=1413187 RepID=A0A0R2NN05_9LACO|nr:hypothetical protein DY78_GL000368 [Lactiplantibacillus fabifermentans DSM 21115]
MAVMAGKTSIFNSDHFLTTHSTFKCAKSDEKVNQPTAYNTNFLIKKASYRPFNKIVTTPN